jgi:hypothetical protein
VQRRNQISDQSTWSHAALSAGSHLAEAGGDSEHGFIEVDMVEGVRSVSIGEFAGAHTRVCRPDGLDDTDRRKVTTYVIERLGNHYDLRNVIDLVRYLFPTPPVPQRFRRRMLALGSGDPTRWALYPGGRRGGDPGAPPRLVSTGRFNKRRASVSPKPKDSRSFEQETQLISARESPS